MGRGQKSHFPLRATCGCLGSSGYHGSSFGATAGPAFKKLRIGLEVTKTMCMREGIKTGILELVPDPAIYGLEQGCQTRPVAWVQPVEALYLAYLVVGISQQYNKLLSYEVMPEQKQN